MIKIALIGLGYWGPNYLRIFSQMDDCMIVACADRDDARLKTFQKNYPEIHFYHDASELFVKESPDATIVATPTTTHFAIALEALRHHQHLLIEKPLALKEEECMKLIQVARQQKRTLMVGHTFLYNNAVAWLKKFVDEGHAGKIFYLHAVRTNLGPIRQDVNALVDLAPHDISVFLYLLGKRPNLVSAHGASFLNSHREDVSFLTLYFDGAAMGHVHVSWLDPRKVRQITVIGDKKMVLFDDVNVLEPIRIYDKGVRQPKEYSDFSEFKTIVYEGDIVIPKIQSSEPLKNQCKEFVEAIKNKKMPLSDGHFGMDVSRVLVGAIKSLKQKGKSVCLS